MKALGCKRGLTDPRDWYLDTPQARNMFSGRKVRGFAWDGTWRAPQATSLDLREWCSPVEDQGSLGSCTAQAVVGMVEYLEKRMRGRHIDASRLFLYKATRTLDGDVGDTGAYIRTTMKALALFGAPPERYWPYDISRYDDVPPAFCYAYGQAYQALRYLRVDGHLRGQELLDTMRAVLALGLPMALGFVVFNYGDYDGVFTMPTAYDEPLGGHAVMACGYDDGRGAFLIRNSWGRSWGDGGYGWLPYGYVLEDYAWDIWALFGTEYFDEGRF